MFWISGNIIISDDFGYFWMNNISKESDESLGRDGGDVVQAPPPRGTRVGILRASRRNVASRRITSKG